jgi:hypothetical protein
MPQTPIHTLKSLGDTTTSNERDNEPSETEMTFEDLLTKIRPGRSPGDHPATDSGTEAVNIAISAHGKYFKLYNDAV